ncbi:MAG: 30S ribosomal protein S6 [Lachnospiraceae bacterium]|nr:30S ribosomal protein S6 [Lachnospiraceae bacterium]
MNKYELAVVVSGKLDEEAANAVVDKAKKLIERFGGQVGTVDAWGKKKFAYEVHKQKDGYYNFVKFEAEPTAPAEIERRMRIMENVLRYLIVSDDDEVVVAAPKEEKPEEETAEPEKEAAVESEAAAEEAPAEEVTEEQA